MRERKRERKRERDGNILYEKDKEQMNKTNRGNNNSYEESVTLNRYFKIALKSDHFILKIKKLNTQKLSIYLQKS